MLLFFFPKKHKQFKESVAAIHVVKIIMVSNNIIAVMMEICSFSATSFGGGVVFLKVSFHHIMAKKNSNIPTVLRK